MNPEFFRARAKAIILMAPVATLSDVKSTGVSHLKDNKPAMEMLKMMGPELFCKPRVTNIINNSFASFFQRSGIGNVSLS